MIPTNVNNLFIKDFIAYENIKAMDIDNIEKIMRIANLFTNVSLSDYENMPFKALEKVKHKVLLLINSKPTTRPKNSFWHDGKRYVACKNEMDFNTNQYTSLKQLEKDSVTNLPQILSLIYVRCPLFNSYKFNENNVKDISEIIFNYGKVGDVYGTLFFYSKRSERLKANLLNSLDRVQRQIAKHMKVVNKELKASGLNTDGTSSLTLSQGATLSKRMS